MQWTGKEKQREIQLYQKQAKKSFFNIVQKKIENTRKKWWKGEGFGWLERWEKNSRKRVFSRPVDRGLQWVQNKIKFDKHRRWNASRSGVSFVHPVRGLLSSECDQNWQDAQKAREKESRTSNMGHKYKGRNRFVTRFSYRRFIAFPPMFSPSKYLHAGKPFKVNMVAHSWYRCSR